MVDRTRYFELPGIEDLDKDQEEAIALPLDGQHLIIGGPGTGKSVVALLRARALARRGKNFVFLVYNHLLHQSSRHLFGRGNDFVFMTWESWFWKLWRQRFDESVPTIPAPDGSRKPVDWCTVESESRHASPGTEDRARLPHLVIDEGQDMPPAFYDAIINLGYENLYVVADQNQKITDACSSLQDLQTALGLDRHETLELTTNYRNSLGVASLARTFYHDRASPPPELPTKPASGTPALVAYDKARPDRPLTFIAERILQFSDRQPTKLVGLITRTNKTREKFLNELSRSEPRLDHGKPPIQTYSHGRSIQFDFGSGGIMVINAQSCKGLEFDYVFLADIDEHVLTSAETMKSLFYVMVSRAREQIFLLRNSEPAPEIEAILTNDMAILARH